MLVSLLNLERRSISRFGVTIRNISKNVYIKGNTHNIILSAIILLFIIYQKNLIFINNQFLTDLPRFVSKEILEKKILEYGNVNYGFLF